MRRHLSLILLIASAGPLAAAPNVPPDEFGNVIPDFSLAGYRNGGVALPVAPVIETLQPAAGGDDSKRIQSALDRVANMPARPADGVRGAVLLDKGIFRCGSTLNVRPGVTLRGKGQDADGTTILATMIPRGDQKPTLIRMQGDGETKSTGTAQPILDEKVPLGTRVLRIDKAEQFRKGDLVIVQRGSNDKWIQHLKMDRIKLSSGGFQWKPDGYRLSWSARVTGVKDNSIALDTPVICAIERQYGGGTLSKATDTRQSGAAVEYLRLESIYQKGAENSDEAHAWNAITLNRIVDSWVRNVTAVHFAYSCVATAKGASRITVQDCAMLDPVSRIKGGRRYSFPAGGQFNLFQRCYTRNGRHDFVVGNRDLGPTVFLDCLAEKAHSDIGPHHRWACGHLYDNVQGGAINVQDRGGAGTGHGWAGNCQILWNCVATSLICQKPWNPGSQNWAVGCIGPSGKPSQRDRPDGFISNPGKHVAPRSLYLAQLEARLGPDSVRAVTTVEQRNGTIHEALRKRFNSSSISRK
jgi:hypothetical protein